MKVLYVSKALVTAAYRDKLSALERFVSVAAVMPDRWGRDPVEPSAAGVPDPKRVPVRLSGHNHLHFYPGARGWLEREDPDLVHIDEEPYSLVTLQLGILCRRRRTPFVFFAWQNLDRRLPPPFARIRAAVFRRATGAIAGTDGAAVALQRAGWRGPTAVVPQFGVDPERFRPDAAARSAARARLGIPEHTFLFGYGGRLIVEKGVHVLLDAFATLDTAARSSCLLWIGDGPEASALADRAAALGVSDRVRFAGRVESTAMPSILPALDLLVLPTIGTSTWTEQFGRILVEAMACGVRVAGSRCGEIPAVIGDAGSLFDPGDVDALARGLEAELHGPEGPVSDGRHRVIERYTQQAVADATAAFYSTLVQRSEVAA